MYRYVAGPDRTVEERPAVPAEGSDPTTLARLGATTMTEPAGAQRKAVDPLALRSDMGASHA